MIAIAGESMSSEGVKPLRRPVIAPLGDSAVVVRFGDSLDDAANRAVLTLAAHLSEQPIVGVIEMAPSLVSLLLRYDPKQINLTKLSGEIGLRLGLADVISPPRQHDIAVRFDGPDLIEVAQALNLSRDQFIAQHNAVPMRVLAIGFAPGFVYCGFHPDQLILPRRRDIRPQVGVGSVLFAAGQTAITATEVPTGWHVIGTTSLRNFDPEQEPPVVLQAGDMVRFRSVS